LSLEQFDHLAFLVAVALPEVASSDHDYFGTGLVFDFNDVAESSPSARFRAYAAPRRSGLQAA
jgi:hypothetical protein